MKNRTKKINLVGGISPWTVKNDSCFFQHTDNPIFMRIYDSDRQSIRDLVEMLYQENITEPSPKQASLVTQTSREDRTLKDCKLILNSQRSIELDKKNIFKRKLKVGDNVPYEQKNIIFTSRIFHGSKPKSQDIKREKAYSVNQICNKQNRFINVAMPTWAVKQKRPAKVKYLK